MPPVNSAVVSIVKQLDVENETREEEIRDCKENEEQSETFAEGDFLVKYNMKLSREIAILEKKKETMKNKLKCLRESVFNDGTKEVELAKQEKDNKKKLAGNEKELEKLEDLKIKKAILKHKKMLKKN